MAAPKKEGEGGGPQQQVINLNLLELPQLNQFKTQVESALKKKKNLKH